MHDQTTATRPAEIQATLDELLTAADERPGPAGITAALDDMLGGGFGSMLAGAFEKMDWAEDEIERAQKRHPAQADLIWHGFKLLPPSHELMGTEFVYRSHCAEILDRLAAGQDTRPGTSAEICCACSDASQVAPLTESAAGLYGRMFARAFPGQGNPWEGSQEHYEALRSGQIDDLEREARRKLTQADRRVTEIECGGRHHGKQVELHRGRAETGACSMRTDQAAHLAAIAQDSGPYATLPAGVMIAPRTRKPNRRPGAIPTLASKAARGARNAGHVAAVLWAHRRQLHRIGWQSAGLLWTVRRAFPWALRVLVVIGAIQIPFLPTDELAAVAALVWIVARYRKLARVIWRAALLEVSL